MSGEITAVAAPELDVHLRDPRTDEVFTLPVIAVWTQRVADEDGGVDVAPVVWLNACAVSIHDIDELSYEVLGVTGRGAPLDSIGRRRLDALRDGQPAWTGHRAT